MFECSSELIAQNQSNYNYRGTDYLLGEEVLKILIRNISSCKSVKPGEGWNPEALINILLLLRRLSRCWRLLLLRLLLRLVAVVNIFSNLHSQGPDTRIQCFVKIYSWNTYLV